MNKLRFLLLLVIVMVSCEEQAPNSFNLDANFEFQVTDQDGQDLLDPENPEAYAESAIRIYYLNEGQMEEVYNGNYDYPRNFLIYGPEGNPDIDSYYLRLFLNYDKEEENPTTFIQWQEGDVDTVRSSFEYTDNAVLIQKVWYNDELVWAKGEEGLNGRLHHIIK